jgi:hypothetical protein
VLPVGFGSDHAAPTDRDPVAEDGRRIRYVVGDHLDHLGHPPLVERLAFLNQDEQLVEDCSGSLHIEWRPRHHDLVAARDKSDLGDEVLHLSQVPIGFSDEVEEQVMAGNA